MAFPDFNDKARCRVPVAFHPTGLASPLTGRVFSLPFSTGRFKRSFEAERCGVRELGTKEPV
jgi:hypothetical protein